MNEQELQQKQLNEIKQLKKDYVSCFSSAAGKKVLADLEKKCFADRTTYNDKRGGIYYNEGMRLVTVYIKNMMNFSIDRLSELVQKGE